MDRRREIEKYFSWLPPPSTVITVKTTDNRSHKLEKVVKLRTINQLESEGRKQENYRLRNLFRESYPKEKELFNTPPHRDVSSIELRQGDKRDRYREESVQTLETPTLRREETTKVERIQGAENGIDKLTEELIESRTLFEVYPDVDSTDKLPTRKDSGSEHYRIGRQAVDVGKLMKSRKKSELNPSQKFLSFSFQNDASYDAGINDESIESMSDLGAVYLKRLDPEALENKDQQQTSTAEHLKDKKENGHGKSEQNEEKFKTGLKKEQKTASEKISTDGRITEELDKEGVLQNEADKSEAPVVRRKSVFIQDDINSEPLDVQEILNRKKSTASFKEKFLSLSVEKQVDHRVSNKTVPNPMTPHGGFYAKRISNRK